MENHLSARYHMQTTSISTAATRTLYSPTSDRGSIYDGHHKKDEVEPVLESTADSDNLQRSPWICYFTSFKQHDAASQDSQQCIGSCTKVSHEEGTCAVAGGLTRISELRPICHLSDLMIDDIIDVSDQNFVDEEKGEKLCSESLLKRLKTVEPDASRYLSSIQFPSSGSVVWEAYNLCFNCQSSFH
ncbi:hypothetical protein K2173_002229 [Erythroxylum novogranatense]|uniref:Uncharacterized protein n=1 Tax=Erythroxylum novogranatense TaxID=1862640 RepID=A0AAV8T959_9ROSI|nr:hypothetical protein K2173_002229 [Erythroxylum novogranatense]